MEGGPPKKRSPGGRWRLRALLIPFRLLFQLPDKGKKRISAPVDPERIPSHKPSMTPEGTRYIVRKLLCTGDEGIKRPRGVPEDIHGLGQGEPVCDNDWMPADHLLPVDVRRFFKLFPDFRLDLLRRRDWN